MGACMINCSAPSVFDRSACLMSGLLWRDVLWWAEPRGRWSLTPVMVMRKERKVTCPLSRCRSPLGRRAWMVNTVYLYPRRQGQWDSSKSNRIWSLFCLEKQLIITKLVQNQMVGQIFDKFWEIKSAKCCWHLATKPIGSSWTWQKSQSPSLSAVETSDTARNGWVCAPLSEDPRVLPSNLSPGSQRHVLALGGLKRGLQV